MTVADESGKGPVGGALLAADYAVGAEEHVLGAMLLSGRAVVEVTGRLGADDFYREAHGVTIRPCVTSPLLAPPWMRSRSRTS